MAAATALFPKASGFIATSAARRPDSIACSASPVASTPTTERSEEHTSELQSQFHLVCRLLLEKKKLRVARDSYRPFPLALRAGVAVRESGCGGVVPSCRVLAAVRGPALASGRSGARSARPMPD